MTTAVPEDWEDLVETLRSDLDTVSNGDPEDEEVRTAIDEVWTIVDAAEDRIGSVDVEEIGEVLGVDTDGNANAIDVGSISREFVSDDPDRAAGLSRLVSLINLDEATDYDVGRLWVDDTGTDDGAGADEGRSSEEKDSESLASNADVPDPSRDAAGEQLRSQLGDALSQFRDRIQDAREGLDDSSGRSGGAEAEGGIEDTDEDTGRESSSTKQRSRTSNRSSTTFSTIPSNRHDIGSVTHFSTMPGRQGRSRTSTRATSEEDRDDRSGSDGED